MSKLNKTLDDENFNDHGVSDSASGLGPDGGPAPDEYLDGDDPLDELEDDAWLDEELSEEELAALGEEDFDDDALLAEELSQLEATLPAVSGLAEDDQADDAYDAFAEEEFVSDDQDEDVFAATAPQEPPLEAAPSAEFDYAAEFEEPVAEVAQEPSFEQAPSQEYETQEPVTPPLADEPPVEAASDHTEEAAAVNLGGAMVAMADEMDGELSDEQAYEEIIEELEEDELAQFMVPRIAVHAFCETPEVTEMMEKSAIDRRLSKAHVTIHMGGIEKAVDHFQTASTPNLIILEALDGGNELLQNLGRLAEVCDPSTKVIIIGRINDITLYRELMAQGVSDYLVKPKSPLKIIKAIASQYADPSAPPIGRTVAFFGARGGVGSSTIAHNVAWSTAQEYQSDTIILDLDLPFGTASLDFEQDPTSGLIEALTAPERLDDVLLDRLLQKYTEHLSLFTAPNLLERDYDLDAQAFETVIDVVKSAAPTIIADVPHVWTAWSKHLLQTADEIVITATPDLASFRNTKNLVDVVAAARPNDSMPILVLNHYDQRNAAVQAEQFEEHVGIAPSLVLAFEPQLFHLAATNAASLLEVGDKSKTAQGLRELAAKVLGRAEVATKKQKFSLAGLFKS